MHVPGLLDRQQTLCCRISTNPSSPSIDSDAQTAHRAVSILFLGGIAQRLGRSLKWDPKNEHFTGDEQANLLLGKALCSPWRL